MKKDEGLSIGKVSKIVGIPVKTLRYYDEIALLSPDGRNAENNYRFYTEKQLETLLIIKNFRAMGFGIKTIQEMLSANNTAEMEKCVREQIAQCRAQIVQMQKQCDLGEDLLVRLNAKNRFFGEEKTAAVIESGSVQIEFIPERTLFTHRQTLDHYNNADISIPQWSSIMLNPENEGYQRCGTYIVTYYEEPLKQFLFESCDVEFGVPVDSAENGEPNQNLRRWGGFDAATLIHTGTYNHIMESHVKLIRWVNQNGYEISGPISEEFIISHMDVKNKNDHVTKIIAPVSPKASG